MVTLPVPNENEDWQRWKARCDAFYAIQTLEPPALMQWPYRLMLHLPTGVHRGVCAVFTCGWMVDRGLIEVVPLGERIEIVSDPELQKMMWILVRGGNDGKAGCEKSA